TTKTEEGAARRAENFKTSRCALRPLRPPEIHRERNLVAQLMRGRERGRTKKWRAPLHIAADGGRQKGAGELQRGVFGAVKKGRQVNRERGMSCKNRHARASG